MTVSRDPNRQPTHPGEIFGEDVLPALAMPIQTAAKHLGVFSTDPTPNHRRNAPRDARNGFAAREVLRQRPRAVAQYATSLRLMARRARNGGRDRQNPHSPRGVTSRRWLPISPAARARRQAASPAPPAQNRASTNTGVSTGYGAALPANWQGITQTAPRETARDRRRSPRLSSSPPAAGR